MFFKIAPPLIPLFVANYILCLLTLRTIAGADMKKIIKISSILNPYFYGTLFVYLQNTKSIITSTDKFTYRHSFNLVVYFIYAVLVYLQRNPKSCGDSATMSDFLASLFFIALSISNPFVEMMICDRKKIPEIVVWSLGKFETDTYNIPTYCRLSYSEGDCRWWVLEREIRTIEEKLELLPTSAASKVIQIPHKERPIIPNPIPKKQNSPLEVRTNDRSVVKTQNPQLEARSNDGSTENRQLETHSDDSSVQKRLTPQSEARSDDSSVVKEKNPQIEPHSDDSSVPKKETPQSDARSNDGSVVKQKNPDDRSDPKKQTQQSEARSDGSSVAKKKTPYLIARSNDSVMNLDDLIGGGKQSTNSDICIVPTRDGVPRDVVDAIQSIVWDSENRQRVRSMLQSNVKLVRGNRKFQSKRRT